MLIGLGLLGMMLHVFLKLRNYAVKQKTPVNVLEYLKAEWYNLVISFIVVIIFVAAKHDIPNIPGLQWVDKALSFGMVVIGYSGQSIAVSIFGKYDKVINEKSPE